jgi:putative membrane protein
LYALVAAALLYRQGGRMSAARSTAAKRWQGAAFYAGLASVALALDSPVDAFADTAFWVHMTQHVLLTMVAPPLLLLGRPWPRLLRPLLRSVRRPAARTVLGGPTLRAARAGVRWIAGPLPAFALFNTTLLLWHLPRLYDLTLRNGLIHDLEHALFFSTALLFWVHLLPAATARPRLSDGARVAYGTGGLLVSWVLAIVLGLAADPVYDAYVSLAHRPGGISALADQQLAAGIMWVPGSVPYCVALFVAVYRWLDSTPGRRRTHLQPRET